MLLEGFDRRFVAVNGVRLHVRTKGPAAPQGRPPLLLLHGYPQTLEMWHPIAPALAERQEVVLCDLRGYGDSAKIEGSDDHAEYSKRTMAADAVALMRALGHDRFIAIGHDRGGRVVHRLCLDAPDAVAAAGVLDIIPTLTMVDTMAAATAKAYWHWLFLAQPRPFPEQMMAAAPDTYLEHTLGASLGRSGLDLYHPDALAAYRRAFHDPGTLHAICEDYRAAASIDLDHDRADQDARIRCPLLVMWGTRGLMAATYDFEAEWRRKAQEVSPAPIDAGHFLVEEAPQAVLPALTRFLDGIA